MIRDVAQEQGNCAQSLITMKNKPVAYYKDITFLQNRERLKLLKEFRFLALQYFENSILNMESGEYSENSVAQDARKRITFFLVEAYTIIRLADIKTAATSSPSLLFGGHGKNMDLILNIFNIGRNDIPSGVVLEYIDKAIELYTSNRLPSFIRSINPFYWIKMLTKKPGKRSGEKAVQPGETTPSPKMPDSGHTDNHLTV